MPFYLPEEETLEPRALQRLQREKLVAIWKIIQENGDSHYRRRFEGIAFNPVTDDWAELPFTTRDELQQAQADHPPYGDFLTQPLSAYTRLHQTSGSRGMPLRWLDTEESWRWWKKLWAVIYHAAGVTEGDRILFAFSFGPFIGFWSAFESAAMLGRFCLTAGGMTTRARLEFLLDHRATVVCCTPTYALHMAAAAREMGLPASSVRLLIVAGEPGGQVPATRRTMEEGWGARVIDHAGMTEIGAWGFECVECPGGLHVIESEFIAEVIDPTKGDTLTEGEQGELVLTNLGRLGSPLIRYRTGDLVRMTRRLCACGRWFAWCEGGILGRVDDMLSIRGNNVFPAAIEGIVRETAGLAEFRMVVYREAGQLELRIEVEEGAPETAGSDANTEAAAGVAGTGGTPCRSGELEKLLVQRIRDRLHFRPSVRSVPHGALPRHEFKAKRLVREDEVPPAR